MKGPKETFLVYLKGIGVGAADVVPGVSGGTIAFITGIYEKLITSLYNIDLQAIKLLFTLRLKELNEKINLLFLLTLLAGVATAVLTLANQVEYLLEVHPVYLFAFFFGLIVASIFIVAQRIRKWRVPHFIWMIAGAVVAFLITTSNVVNTPDTGLYIFLAGMISIMAMILPGISGSFILLILNKYHTIIGVMAALGEVVKGYLTGDTEAAAAAYAEARLDFLLWFYLGAMVGLLGFSRVLKWLFSRYHDITIAILTGFMIGSLNKVWPWKMVVETFVDRHGEVQPLIEENVLPPSYGPNFWITLGLGILGFLVVYVIEKLSVKQEGNA